MSVEVVFADDRRRLTLADGKSAHFLKPGVEVYDAAGKVLFRSKLEVLSVTVNGQAVPKMTGGDPPA
jgi:hypothetical protein